MHAPRDRFLARLQARLVMPRAGKRIRMQSSQGISLYPEPIAAFDFWPSGIAVSRSGRVFVSFPRIASERAPATLAELIDGRPVPFPDALVNGIDPSDAVHRFVSVHGIIIGPGNRLLALDTGAHAFTGADPHAAKLWVIDLDHNVVAHGIGFAHDVCLPTTYLNDLVIDYNRGKAGTAFISDSGASGPNAIIVVDLDSGKAHRRLSGHASVRVPVPAGFLIATELGMTAAPPTIDGIALSPDGRTLWWTPLGAYDFFSVDTDVLCAPGEDDPAVADAIIARHVVSHGARAFASDGLDCDREGRVYFTDVTHGTVQRYIPGERRFERLFGDRRPFRWPDAVRLAHEHEIFVTDSQRNRSPLSNDGVDLREPPYKLYRAANDAEPGQF
jgi:sugar lactone lactonase YvrE